MFTDGLNWGVGEKAEMNAVTNIYNIYFEELVDSGYHVLRWGTCKSCCVGEGDPDLSLYGPNLRCQLDIKKMSRRLLGIPRGLQT